MNNADTYDLGTVAITTAVTGSVITEGTSSAGTAQAFIDRLDGMTALTVQFKLAYGSGGASAKAWLQTSLDNGATWIDIACAAFTTVSATKVFNLSGLTPKTSPVTPTDGTLADDTCVDGILGDRLRVKVTTTGTYAGSTTLAVKATAR